MCWCTRQVYLFLRICTVRYSEQLPHRIHLQSIFFAKFLRFVGYVTVLTVSCIICTIAHNIAGIPRLSKLSNQLEIVGLKERYLVSQSWKVPKSDFPQPQFCPLCCLLFLWPAVGSQNVHFVQMCFCYFDAVLSQIYKIHFESILYFMYLYFGEQIAFVAFFKYVYCK